ncbi:hypothetical protein I7I48_00302 [Histoplasma ohiense]|nr:hypothetical protein I7I48_00302 [Histoplasma ohiense (nom. inval.)]
MKGWRQLVVVAGTTLFLAAEDPEDAFSPKRDKNRSSIHANSNQFRGSGALQMQMHRTMYYTYIHVHVQYMYSTLLRMLASQPKRNMLRVLGNAV